MATQSPNQVAVPVTPATLALSDLALDAAIALDRHSKHSQAKLDAVGELAEALTESTLNDLALIPVYDKALASGGMAGASSKNDFDARLRAIAAKMQSTESASPKDIETIRDFCVALHDALLTIRFQAANLRTQQRFAEQYHRSVSGKTQEA